VIHSVAEHQKRERGRVRWFKADKGYGRITSDDSTTFLFVHFSSIVQDADFRALREEQVVEYTRIVQPGPNGPRPVAVDVIAV
jgi:cold shock protein